MSLMDLNNSDHNDRSSSSLDEKSSGNHAHGVGVSSHMRHREAALSTGVGNSYDFDDEEEAYKHIVAATQAIIPLVESFLIKGIMHIVMDKMSYPLMEVGGLHP